MLRLTILFAAVASISNAFMLPSAVAGLTLQQSNGFEVTAHGLVHHSAKQNVLDDFCPDSPAEQISTHRSTSQNAVDATSARRLVTDSASSRRPRRRRRDVYATAGSDDHTPDALTGHPARAGRADAERHAEARRPPRVHRRSD